MHSKIFAGSGADKTHFLVENVKNIVMTHPYVAKSSARKVLCITYTNAAVDEIVHRLDRYADSVEIHTIHGFIIEHIIKPFQQDLRDIISEEFRITIEGNGKITLQVEGLGILHGVDKAEIFKYIAEKTAETAEVSYSKKSWAMCKSKLQIICKTPHRSPRRNPIKNYLLHQKLSILMYCL